MPSTVTVKRFFVRSELPTPDATLQPNEDSEVHAVLRQLVPILRTNLDPEPWIDIKDPRIVTKDEPVETWFVAARELIDGRTKLRPCESVEN